MRPVEKYKEYLDKLDVYVVSSGGVSSNYVNTFLSKNGLKVGTSSDLWGKGLCHTKHVFTRDTKTIYLYGDWQNAIYSQANRGLTKMNMNKIHFQNCNKNKNIEYFIKNFPTDPYGISFQHNQFINNTNTWMLKYPFTKEDFQNIIIDMGLDISTDTFSVKPRNTTILKKPSKRIDEIIKIYENNIPY